ncbi:MAG TPA: hypothetical protein VGB78_11925 [Thermoplasmata archaeon]
MRHDNARNAALILSIAWLAMVMWLVYGLYSMYKPSDGPHIFQAIKMYSALLGGVVILVLSLVLDYGLATVDTDPKTTLAILAHRLRVLAYRVKEDRKGIKVQITSSTAIRITASTSGGRTIVRYKPEQTASGWAALIILALSFYGLMIASAIGIAAIRKAKNFAQRLVLPQILGARPMSGESAAESIRSTLIDGLSEGYRLASEAYEAQRSNYQDGILAVITVAIFVWLLSFISFVTLIKGQSLWDEWQVLVIASVIVTTIFCIPPFLYLRQKVRAKAYEFKSWSTRLQTRLMQETSLAPPKDADQSVFEVLNDVSKEIPKWMKAMRKAGMFADPWTWLVIFSLAYAAFELLLWGIVWSPPNPGMQIPLFLGGGAMAIGSYLIYTRWRVNQQEEELAVTASWETRLRKAKVRMQNHLEEL